MQAKDKVIAVLPTGMYYGEIINSNDYRTPDTKYAIRVHARNGFVAQDGIIFAGETELTKMEVL